MHAEEPEELEFPCLELGTEEALEGGVLFFDKLFHAQRRELEKLVQSFQDVFREEPGWA